MYLESFDHQPSEIVEVRSQRHGDFVQVYDSPGRRSRRVVLSYLRTPDGPKQIRHHLRFDEGPFSYICVSASARVYHYRDKSRKPRLEEFLPTGKMLVDDPQNGHTMERIFSADFDWERLEPVDPLFDDPPILNRQSAGKPWYVTTYQIANSEPTTLWLVEEHEGQTLKRVVEIGPAKGGTGKLPPFRPPSNPSAAGSCVSIYFSASRTEPLSSSERQEIDTLIARFRIEEKTDGLRWESLCVFDPKRPSEPDVIFAGSVRPPSNTDEAFLIGMQHWCKLLAEIRKNLPSARWLVQLDDHELAWDEARQEYDLSK
jgi:hypothetical protein